MLKSSFLKSGVAIPVRLLHRFLFLALLASPLMAFGQDFTMMVTEPYPSAVDAGQDSKSYINLGTVNGFTGNVSLSCTVSPLVTNGPTCTPPATAMPPQQVAMSITVGDLAPAGFYTLTVTATGPAPSTPKSANISLTVLSITPDYTLAVTTTIFPTSVHAGYPAIATVTVSPINGYSGTVTLSCSSITPLATPAPSCSFAPAAVGPQANGLQPPYTSVLTITTTGPTAPPPPSTTASLAGSHGINGGGLPASKPNSLWFAFPGLSLIALALATSGRRRRRLGVLSVFFLAAATLLFVPGCENYTNTGLNGSTPKNTYVFTLTGADTQGVAPSNEATPPTVSLTVN
jgi:hypothetical protein